jgi:hypothetical protein
MADLIAQLSELENKAIFYAKSVAALAEIGDLDTIKKYHAIDTSLDFSDCLALRLAIKNRHYKVAHYILHHADYNKCWSQALMEISARCATKFDAADYDFARHLFKHQPNIAVIVVDRGLKSKYYDYTRYHVKSNDDYLAGICAFIKNSTSRLMEKLCFELITAKIPSTKKHRCTYLTTIIQNLFDNGRLELLANFIDALPDKILDATIHKSVLDDEKGVFVATFNLENVVHVNRLTKLFGHIKWYSSTKPIVQANNLELFMKLVSTDARPRILTYAWGLAKDMSKQMFELWHQLGLDMSTLNTIHLCNNFSFEYVYDFYLTASEIDTIDLTFLYYAAIAFGRLDVLPSNFNAKKIGTAFIVRLFKTPHVHCIEYLESHGKRFNFKNHDLCYLRLQDFHPDMQDYFGKNPSFSHIEDRKIYLQSTIPVKAKIEAAPVPLVLDIEISQVDLDPQPIVEAYVELLKQQSFAKKLAKAKSEIYGSEYFYAFTIKDLYIKSKDLALTVVRDMPVDFVHKHLDEITELVDSKEFCNVVLELLLRSNVERPTMHVLNGSIANGNMQLAQEIVKTEFDGIFPHDMVSDLFWYGVRHLSSAMINWAYKWGFKHEMKVTGDETADKRERRSYGTSIRYMKLDHRTDLKLFKSVIKAANFPNRDDLLKIVARVAANCANGKILEYINNKIGLDLADICYLNDEEMCYDLTSVKLMIKHKIKLSEGIDVRHLSAYGDVPLEHAKLLMQLMEQSDLYVYEYSHILASRYVQTANIEGVAYLSDLDFDFDEFFNSRATIYTGGFADECFSVGSSQTFYSLCTSEHKRAIELLEYFIVTLKQETLAMLARNADDVNAALLVHLRSPTGFTCKDFLEKNIITPDPTNPEMVAAYREAERNAWRQAARYHPGNIDMVPILSRAKDHFENNK